MPNIRCAPEEGTRAFQSYSFRPADPAWAPVSLLERCRTVLRDYSWQLDLWWSPMRGYGTFPVGRWRVVQWLEKSGAHDTVFYWEAGDGSYREPSPEGLLKKVQQCDMWARGDDLQSVSKRVDESNDVPKAKAERTKLDDAWDKAHDAGLLANGPGANRQAHQRKSFDMKPRPRLILP